MPIRIRYRPDTFGRKTKQVARIHYSRTLDYDDLLDLASDGARVQKTNIAIAMESLTGAIVRLLADGKRVRTPLGIFELALRPEKHNDEHRGRANRIGRGEQIEFTVTPERLRVVFRPNRGLSARIRKQATIVRDHHDTEAVPVINEVQCLERAPNDSGTTAPGELLRLEGYRLSFDQSDAETGLFFIREDERAFRVAVYGHVGTNVVITKCPPLPAATYRLQVRTRPTGTTVRESPRSDPLVVLEQTPVMEE